MKTSIDKNLRSFYRGACTGFAPLLGNIDIAVCIGSFGKANNALDQSNDRRNECPAEKDIHDAHTDLAGIELMDTQPAQENSEQAVSNLVDRFTLHDRILLGNIHRYIRVLHRSSPLDQYTTLSIGADLYNIIHKRIWVSHAVQREVLVLPIGKTDHYLFGSNFYDLIHLASVSFTREICALAITSVRSLEL